MGTSMATSRMAEGLGLPLQETSYTVLTAVELQPFLNIPLTALLKEVQGKVQGFRFERQFQTKTVIGE